MVPNGWKLERVGDLFDVQLGKMLNQEAKDKTPQFHYLGNSNVKWGSFDLSDLKTMHFSERDVEKFTLELDDIIMCEGGEVGRCAIWQGSDTAIFYQKALHRLRSKGQIIPQFFQSYMEKISGTKLLDDYTSRTSIAHLTREKLISLPVRLPPIPEQKEIANILSTWDKAISTTEQLLANSQQQKKALMQQLLTGKKRLLDNNGVRFSGGWRERLLGDISKITTGSSNRQDSHMNGAYTFFDRSEDIRTSDTYLFDCEAVIVPGEGQDFIPKYFVGKFDLHQRTYAIMDFPECHGKFLFYAIHYFRSHFLSQAVGSTVKSLRLPMFQKMKLNLPTFEEQQKIAVVISTADQEITTLQQKLDALKQEKKALMQQLLTGKRRVKVVGAA
ncbi:restriction endonuclease subunit S [Aeromonas veronii]|uniref:restriction endonuclease subunit S n=1 Tax=Aeromonas veronii TaxID=654 RepID=UPI0039F6780E